MFQEAFHKIVLCDPKEDKRKFIFLVDDLQKYERFMLNGFYAFPICESGWRLKDFIKCIDSIHYNMSKVDTDTEGVGVEKWTYNQPCEIKKYYCESYYIIPFLDKKEEEQVTALCNETTFNIIPSKRLWKCLKVGNDIPPSLFNGNQYHELKERIEKFIKKEIGEPEKKRRFPKLKRANDIKNADIPELNVIVGVGEEVPFLVEGTCILSAKPKLGKSWLASQMCKCVTEGSDFLGYKTKKCHAVYFDLETADTLQKKRLNKMCSDDLDNGYYIVDSLLPEEPEEGEKPILLGDGFEKYLEEMISEDPQIQLIIVDVFQKVRKPKKSNESDYDVLYRDISPINRISKQYHISIVLVCHDRKTVDVNDPFANILGSTALQGATDQMMVLYKDKFNDEYTHIAVKGRTIDGIVEIEAKMDSDGWTRSDMSAQEIRKQKSEKDEYKEHPYRTAMKQFLRIEPDWRGRCGEFVNKCKEYGIGIEDNLKAIGLFFSKYEKLALEVDGISISSSKNGSGSKTYSLHQRITVDTTIGTVGTVGQWQVVEDVENIESAFK